MRDTLALRIKKLFHDARCGESLKGPFVSSQHQSLCIGSVPGIPQQHPGEANFFGARPSPHSTRRF